MHPRIGIIGAGNMGATHGKSIHWLNKQGIVAAEIAAVADPDPARLESFQRASRAPFATTDPLELIASPSVNTVYICTPTVAHRQLALAVAAAGKALFCEKPLAFNAADAAAMQRAATAARITHQVGLVMRYSAVIHVTRDLIHAPGAGRPMTAAMVDDQFFPIQGHYASTWRKDRAQVGAGTLLEHAIHDIDLLVWCLGPVRRVHAATRNFAGHEGIEDLSAALLEFESGAVVAHTSIWHNILHRGSSRRLNVTCENLQFSWDDDDWAGAIRVDDARGRSVIESGEVVRRFVDLAGITHERLREALAAPNIGLAYVLENYDFLRAVTDQRPAPLGFAPAVYAHAVVDAIYRSARESRPVDVASMLPEDAAHA